jgi:hypothetical protein
MAHLFIGLAFGLILHKIYHNKNIIIFCAIGSVLPDQVSKIFGHFLLTSSSARFYSQTLALFLLFLIIGLFVWKYYRSNSLLAVAVGIFLHKIADTWPFPDWNFPLFGPSLAKMLPGYFQSIILTEINSVTEWIFFIATLIIVFYLVANKDPPLDPDRKKELFRGILGIILIIFILFVSILYILPLATAF